MIDAASLDLPTVKFFEEILKHQQDTNKYLIDKDILVKTFNKYLDQKSNDDSLGAEDKCKNAIINLAKKDQNVYMQLKNN